MGRPGEQEHRTGWGGPAEGGGGGPPREEGGSLWTAVSTAATGSVCSGEAVDRQC